MIEAAGLTKRYGQTLAVDNLSFTVQPRAGHRLPRPERGGQVHHHADDPRAWTTRPAARSPSAASATTTEPAAAHRRRAARREVGAPEPLGAGAPAVDGQVQPAPGEPRRRGARPRRPDLGRGQARRRVLARHVAAARHRGRPARRPGGAAVRRAGERPRPRGHPLDPQVHAAPRRRGPHGARVQPPALGDGADRAGARS